MRLNLVDGIRGHLLIGMLIAHMSLANLVPALGYIHHHFFIRMYDAEFFVPISGFIIGYLYVEKIRTSAAFYRFMNGRLLTIYKYYLLSAVPFLVAALIANPAADAPGAFLDVVTMQNGGHFSDILPIYFYCFLILYALFWMVPRVGFGAPLAVSGAIYLASQISYRQGVFGISGDFVIFDIAAWQFLFVLFLCIGAHWRTVLGWMKRISDRQYLWVVAGLAVALLVGRQTNYYPTPFAGHEALNVNWPRMQLHPIFLAKILVVIAMVCAILTRPTGPLALPNRAMRWYFQLPILTNIGKFSIQMFTLHVFILAAFMEVAPVLDTPARYMLAVTLIVTFMAAPNLWVLVKSRRARLEPALA